MVTNDLRQSTDEHLADGFPYRFPYRFPDRFPDRFPVF